MFLNFFFLKVILICLLLIFSKVSFASGIRLYTCFVIVIRSQGF